DDDGLPLRRARDVERPADVIELAVVIELVHLGAVEKDAGFLVADESILVPGIPQRAHHLNELAAALIALRLGQMRLLAEVLRLGFVAGRDHIPAGAAATDQ